jgi:vitamin B12 transporter
MGNGVGHNRKRQAAASIGVGALALFAPTALQAQANVGGEKKDDDTIVVTATRSGQGVNPTLLGSSFTAVDFHDMEDREIRIVSDVLRDIPGVAVSRAGAVGGPTQVRIRGTEGNQVLVLIDGIKASDPYRGEFDWATLIADDAARIEVLRGQQSALYGSDAIGGVINYITLSGREAPGARFRGEIGSFGTYDGTARVAGTAGEKFDYALSGSFNHTNGYPTAPSGTRDAGSENVGTSGKVNWTPSDVFTLSGVLRYNYTKADINDQGITASSPLVNGRQVQTVVDTPSSYYKNGAWYGIVRGELNLMDGMLTTAISGQFADTYRDAYALFGYSYGDKGTRYRGSLENTLRFGDHHVKHALTLAIDVEREEFRNVDPSGFADTRKHVLNTVGFVGEYRVTVDDKFAVGASIRHNKNDFFNDDTTWHADATYNFSTGTRLHAAGGTGTKNPGSFELFGYSTGQYIGNPDLRPEKSEGWEVGIDQSFMNSAITIGATYFNSRLTNEIYTDYLPPLYLGTSINRTTTIRQRGLEFFGQARLGDVRIDASFTYLDAPQFRNVLLNPTDLTSFATGPVQAQAVRRPEHIGSFNLTYAPMGTPFSGTVTVRYNGRMNDVVFDKDFSPMYHALKGVTLVNLSFRYDMAKNLQVYARADNLFDETYQEVFTFNAPGRAVYGGLRMRF